MRNLRVRPFAYFIFFLFAICFLVVDYTGGSPTEDVWTALRTAYKTIPILLALWLPFAFWAWRWRVFRNWLVPFPCLDGTWQGHIQTTWRSPKTGETPGPIPVVLTIQQSFVRISCVMRTAEMTSHSYFSEFWIDNEQQVRKLTYCYTSAPLISLRDRSQVHDGAMTLELVGDPVSKLRGIYWTTRKTTGEVTLSFRCRERLDEFPDDLGAHPMNGR